jgi:Protein of unknown function (DUF3489)
VDTARKFIFRGRETGPFDSIQTGNTEVVSGPQNRVDFAPYQSNVLRDDAATIGAASLRTSPALELERGCGGDGAIVPRFSRREAIMTKLTTRKSATREHRSTKLTTAQLGVLSDAALREDGAAAMPEGKNEKAAQKLAATLIEQALVREIRAKPGMPVWRRDEEGRALALIITKGGRTAIDMPEEGRTEDASTGPDAPAMIGVHASARSGRGTPRQGSKLAEVMSLLGRKKGAGIEDLIAATGWLPHTTRAALTGLRKRGFAIERSRNEQATVYRIVTGTAPALAA